jgi:hypothetical protein
MESTTVQVLLTELETARESLDRVFACLSPVPKTLNNELRISGHPVPRHFPIKVVTENGFAIMRACERQSSKTDSASGCYFIVRGPNEEEHYVTVVFREEPIGLIRSLQRSNRLPFDSPFWLQCAESHLANYLWETNDYPPQTGLTIDRLSDENLRLAMRAHQE